MSNTHATVRGSERRPLPGAVARGRANPNTVIDVTLKLRRMAALPELLDRPKTVLTRQQLASTYGASAQDADDVTSAFQRLASRWSGAILPPIGKASRQRGQYGEGLRCEALSLRPSGRRLSRACRRSERSHRRRSHSARRIRPRQSSCGLSTTPRRARCWSVALGVGARCLVSPERTGQPVQFSPG